MSTDEWFSVLGNDSSARSTTYGIRWGVALLGVGFVLGFVYRTRGMPKPKAYVVG